MATPVIAIFDIGKTNKKALLFDQSYRVVYETSARLEETTDEDGDPCEDVDALTKFIYASLDELFDDSRWEVRAVNFSAYGASFVCVDAAGIPVCPLYNYLKPYPPELSRQFYDRYGGEQEFSAATASPVLGSLNSGMQLFRIRQRHPEVFKRIRYALHLPQYLSFLLSRKPVSDITSIGCHTNLWDFRQGTYHEWVSREGIMEKLAPPVWPSERFQAHYKGRTLIVGAGLHDSSAALIPYLKSFSQPFILLSTGTWNISLNPFNNAPLTAEELAQDCLCYLTYEGKAVKASRFFAGPEYERQVGLIARAHGLSVDAFAEVKFDPAALERTRHEISAGTQKFDAYHKMMMEFVGRQRTSTMLVRRGSPIKKMFVDGGFSRNEVFMNLLAAAFPELDVCAASMAQGSALGAAIALHQHWNPGPLPSGIVSLKQFGGQTATAL